MILAVRLEADSDDPPTRPAPAREDVLRPLAAAARGGDRKATRALLEALGPSVLRVVRGVLGARHRDVDDVVQNAMVGLLRALPSYREECTVKHFAARIAVRTAADHLRHLGRLSRADAKGLKPLEDEAPSDDPAAVAQRRALVVMLLDELSTVQAEALVLRAVMGCSVEEIAAATEVPANTVRSRLRLAKQAIARRLSADPSLRALAAPELATGPFDEELDR